MRYVVGAAVIIWVVVRIAQWIWALVLDLLSALVAIAVPVLGGLAALVAVVAAGRIGLTVLRRRPRCPQAAPASSALFPQAAAAPYARNDTLSSGAPSPGRPPRPDLVTPRVPAASDRLPGAGRGPTAHGRTSASARRRSYGGPAERRPDRSRSGSGSSPTYGDQPGARPGLEALDRRLVHELLASQRSDSAPSRLGPAAAEPVSAAARQALIDSLPGGPVPDEQTECAPGKRVPITIILEPHRTLNETGRAGPSIDHLQVTETPHVILSSARNISWTAEYRIKSVEVDADSLVDHLSGTARGALQDLVRDPDDESANRRFRDALTRIREEPEQGGRREYEGRPGLEVTTVGCDFVVEGAERDITARTRHVVASGEISLAGLLQENAELVRGFALSLSGQADPGQRQEFARDLSRAVQRMSPSELVLATRFPDEAATIRLADRELTVNGAAIAAVGEPARIREKLRAELGRVGTAAPAELTCRDLGVKPPEADAPHREPEREPSRDPAPLPPRYDRDIGIGRELTRDRFDRLWPF